MDGPRLNLGWLAGYTEVERTLRSPDDQGGEERPDGSSFRSHLDHARLFEEGEWKRIRELADQLMQLLQVERDAEGGKSFATLVSMEGARGVANELVALLQKRIPPPDPSVTAPPQSENFRVVVA